MQNLFAVLIKNEIDPKFVLINDADFKQSKINSSRSEREYGEKILRYLGLSDVDIKNNIIEKIIFMGNEIPDPFFLKNLVNKNGEMILCENFEDNLKSHKVRKNRELIFEKLDKDYLKAFSMNDTKAMKKINENKQFLRDLTKKPIVNSEGEVFNLFFNISDLIIKDSGCGYDFPPKITIAPPNSDNVPDIFKMQIGSAGETAQATCSIKNGVIDSISMKNWGCGYFYPPSISVESPTSKDSRTAVLLPVVTNILGFSR